MKCLRDKIPYPEMECSSGAECLAGKGPWSPFPTMQTRLLYWSRLSEGSHRNPVSEAMFSHFWNCKEITCSRRKKKEDSKRQQQNSSYKAMSEWKVLVHRNKKTNDKSLSVSFLVTKGALKIMLLLSYKLKTKRTSHSVIFFFMKFVVVNFTKLRIVYLDFP